MNSQEKALFRKLKYPLKVYSPIASYNRFIYFFSTILLFTNKSVSAQDSTKVTNQIWNTISLTRNLGYVEGTLAIEYDKEISGNKEYNRLSFEPGVEYYPSNTLDLFMQIYIDFTEQMKGSSTTEFRPVLGARWNIIKPEKRVYIRFIPQFEYRFFKSRNYDTLDNSSRFRLAVEGRVSITQKSYNESNNLYAVIKGEYFLHGQDNINERFWNQYRIYTGLGYKLNAYWRFEAQYIYQASKNNQLEKQPDSLENVIYLKVSTNIFKRSKSVE